MALRPRLLEQICQGRRLLTSWPDSRSSIGFLRIKPAVADSQGRIRLGHATIGLSGPIG